MTQANAETPAPTSLSSEPPAPASAAPAPAAPAAASPTADKPARPDWVGEQFWDADKGEIKGPDLKTAFDELTAFKAGEESKRAAAPEKPEGYELKLPEGLDFGEGVTFQLDEADPMFAFGRSVAHELGLDQPGFEKLVGSYAKMQVEQAKADGEVFKAQLEQLGPKGAERQKAVETWISAKLGPDAATLFGGITKFKAGVETLEKVMRLASGGGAPGFTQTGREGAGKDKIEGWADMSAAEKMAAARRR
jgi:hypothetical protein